MTPRPVPGPWLPPPIGPRHIDTTPAEVEWQAQCDRCGDAARPVCTCTCQSEEGVA